MNLVRSASIVLASALLLSSCASLGGGSFGNALGGAIGGAIVGGAVGGGESGPSAVSSVPEAVADFRPGEVLCSAEAVMRDGSFYVAQVLSPASAATKNQAEVVYISDGSKAWVNFVVGSRKATKADFALGKTLFYIPGWAGYDNISADSYRKDGWALGNVTSVEYLYKNQIEINGEPYVIDFVRVPTDPIK